MPKTTLAAVLVLQLCAVVGVRSQERVTLAGSSTIHPLIEVAAQAFEARHPGFEVDVQAGGSSVGIASTLRGMADIGMVSRGLSEEEKQRLVPTTIALDGLAIIVHATNPLRNITRQQVIDVYAGRVSNWKALGGPDAPITVINKEAGRATLELFEDYFDLEGKFVRNAVIIGPNGQAIASVAGMPHSIAYVSIGSATVAEEQGVALRRLSLDGVTADVAHVTDQSYGLRRPLLLVTKGVPRGPVKQFLDFVLSAEGQQIVLEQEFVPVSPGGGS
jgi:phosphate transport system substrate-binding protein